MPNKTPVRIEPPIGWRRPMRFGEFITGVYDALDKHAAMGIVWLAVHTRLVEFQGRERYLISKKR
jgi:hypothetical protein